MAQCQYNAYSFGNMKKLLNILFNSKNVNHLLKKDRKPDGRYLKTYFLLVYGTVPQFVQLPCLLCFNCTYSKSAEKTLRYYLDMNILQNKGRRDMTQEERKSVLESCGSSKDAFLQACFSENTNVDHLAKSTIFIEVSSFANLRGE